MKILFLSHTDSNLYLFRLPIMLALQAQGHEVIALTPKGADFDKFAPLGIQAIDYSINRGSLNPLSAFKTIQEITKILQETKPDIVHTFMLKPNIYGAFAAKIAGLDCVINSLTGLGSFYIDESPKSRVLRFIIESLNRLAFRIAQKVLFQNNDDLELYVQKGIVKREKAILIKGSGIDTQAFAPINQESYHQMRQKLSTELNLPLTRDSILVLMVARAIAHKGVREYYRAAEILKANNPHCIFLYVGGVDLGNISSMNEEFLKGSTAVIYLGQRNDICSLVGACDLFVLPSYREGIPRTLLEAGSMAKSIITTNAVGCREVVENGKNGFLVEIGNAEELAQRIAQLSKDKDLQARFGQTSREKICAEFSTDSIVKSYLSLYHSVLDSTSKQSFGIYKDFIKPLLDISLGAILLALFSPILLVVALLIRTKLGSPVFFMQERPGKEGKIFKIYKFRTMNDARDEKGELLPDEARLTQLGKWIRKSSLDELPQLFNVLKGEMSFVGPRPLLVEYLPLYSKEQARRHEVKPGITGWAQINGRNAISWEEKFALDVWYVNHLSFWLDCKILWGTFYKVIQRKDISSGTSATMEKFQGNKTHSCKE